MAHQAIPAGWLTVPEAAAASGYAEAVVRRRVRAIRQDTAYTIMGLTLESLQQLDGSHSVIGVPPEGPESLPIRRGNQLKALFQGRTILNAEMVAHWKRARDETERLKSVGYKTVEEIAKELGATAPVIRAALKALLKKPTTPAQQATLPLGS